MNEWSPGCGFSRPVAPNQRNQMRPLRSPWDEENIDRVNSNKSVVLNYRAATDPRSKSFFQQRSQENISKTSLSGINRIKKHSIGSSDPRFKRVISTGIHNNACVGTELKKAECSSPAIADKQDCPAAVDWNSADPKKPQNGKIAAEGAAENMKNEAFERSMEQHSNAVDSGFGTNRSVREHLKEAEKFSFNHELIPNSFPKQSLSDCTIDTRNASLVSGELGDEFADKLHSFSSTTRVKKVQNWIAEQKPKLDRRQSVITVIGQTQGASSSAFQEIDQRRKLVKELDKYAICNKITDSDKDREINTLVAQIKFLSPSHKILYSNDRDYNVKELSCKTDAFTSKHQETEKVPKKVESNINDEFPRDNYLNVENDLSSNLSSRNSCVNKKKSCIIWENEHNIRGKIRHFLQHVPYYWLAHLMVVLSGILCWYTYFALQKNGIFFFGFIPRKPKPATWYEKVYSWLWEFVRPSSVSDS